MKLTSQAAVLSVQAVLIACLVVLHAEIENKQISVQDQVIEKKIDCEKEVATLIAETHSLENTFDPRWFSKQFETTLENEDVTMFQIDMSMFRQSRRLNDIITDARIKYQENGNNLTMVEIENYIAIFDQIWYKAGNIREQLRQCTKKWGHAWVWYRKYSLVKNKTEELIRISGCDPTGLHLSMLSHFLEDQNNMRLVWEHLGITKLKHIFMYNRQIQDTFEKIKVIIESYPVDIDYTPSSENTWSIPTRLRNLMSGISTTLSQIIKPYVPEWSSSKEHSNMEEVD